MKRVSPGALRSLGVTRLIWHMKRVHLQAEGKRRTVRKEGRKERKKMVLLLLAFPYYRRTAVFRNLVFFSLLPYATHPDCVKRERKHR